MLVDHEIRDAAFRSDITIDPFNEAQLNSNSYDVQLGDWFCLQQDIEQKLKSLPVQLTSGTTFILGSSPSSIMWSEPVQKSRYIIRPGETILAHTKEIIGGLIEITTEMRAKSTVGRSGIEVCKCAGLGDVGFISRWTMEITNNSLMPVLLTPGIRIAQIIFFKTRIPTKPYAGRYGQGEWVPEDMLPKPSRDGDI